MIPARTAVSKREEVKPRRRGSRTMFVSTALELEHGGGPAVLTLHDRRRRGGDGGNPIPCIDKVGLFSSENNNLATHCTQIA